MQDKVLGVRASPCELRMDTIQPIEASETQSSQDHILSHPQICFLVSVSGPSLPGVIFRVLSDSPLASHPHPLTKANPITLSLSQPPGFLAPPNAASLWTSLIHLAHQQFILNMAESRVLLPSVNQALWCLSSHPTQNVTCILPMAPRPPTTCLHLPSLISSFMVPACSSMRPLGLLSEPLPGKLLPYTGAPVSLQPLVRASLTPMCEGASLCPLALV